MASSPDQIACTHGQTFSIWLAENQIRWCPEHRTAGRCLSAWLTKALTLQLEGVGAKSLSTR